MNVRTLMWGRELSNDEHLSSLAKANCDGSPQSSELPRIQHPPTTPRDEASACVSIITDRMSLLCSSILPTRTSRPAYSYTWVFPPQLADSTLSLARHQDETIHL
jgi:hypothetical protein